MKKLDLKETQDCLFQILKYVDEVLEGNNLNYSLAYGTLIGAARHKGFIPWDDDLDIVMPYDDYLKMLKIPELNDRNNRYTLHYGKTERGYGYPFAKIEDNTTICKFKKTTDSGGAFLDIFPMTPLPQKNNKLYARKMGILHNKLAFLNSKSDNLLKNTVRSIASPLRGYYRDKMEKEAFKYNNEESELLTESMWSNDRLGQAVPKEWFKNYTKLEFESSRFKVISKYSNWLKIIYGNWEKLPSKEERVGHHEFVLYTK